MDLIIKKFLNYLEEYVNDFEKEKIKFAYMKGKEDEPVSEIVEEVIIIKSFQHYFENNKEDMKIVFNDFSTLSNYLFDSPLNIQEQMSIIFEICKRNYLLTLESGEMFYDLNKVNKLRFQKMGHKDITLMWFGSVFPNIFCCSDNVLTNEGSKSKRALINSPQLYTVDNYDVLDNCTIIKTCYFDKIDSYTKEDVQEIMMALKNLGVNKELCQSIRNILLRDMNQRLEQERLSKLQKQDVTKLNINKDSFQIWFHSRINYEEIYSELEKVVDLRDMWAKCSLTLEKTIYYVSLLLRIKVERSKIQFFLKNVEIQNNGVSHNPIALYLELYDKLKYYENRLVLSENLKLLEDYFQELFIANDEEYEFWKSNLSQELRNYLNTIPGSFDYEIDMAKKRLEKKK